METVENDPVIDNIHILMGRASQPWEGTASELLLALGEIAGERTVSSQSRVLVSDIHRTIIDMLDDPTTGSGIQHVADCFAQYMQRKDGEPHLLIDYADQLGNGAVFKRLGFLAECHPHGDVLIDAAKLRLTRGYAKLDPALDCSRLITRWRLRVPRTWTEKGRPG